jgi:hypothetical protein
MSGPGRRFARLSSLLYPFYQQYPHVLAFPSIPSPKQNIVVAVAGRYGGGRICRRAGLGVGGGGGEGISEGDSDIVAWIRLLLLPLASNTKSREKIAGKVSSRTCRQLQEETRPIPSTLAHALHAR